MNNESEKQNIKVIQKNYNTLKINFKNLVSLMTIGERGEIKRWVGNAKEKNAEEGS